MKARASFIVVRDDALQREPLVIQDIGPHTKYPTVTNDVEAVVAQLVAERRLPPGRRLLYYDSGMDLDEIVVEGGRFVRFAPVAARTE